MSPVPHNASISSQHGDSFGKAPMIPKQALTVSKQKTLPVQATMSSSQAQQQNTSSSKNEKRSSPNRRSRISRVRPRGRRDESEGEEEPKENDGAKSQSDESASSSVNGESYSAQSSSDDGDDDDDEEEKEEQGQKKDDAQDDGPHVLTVSGSVASDSEPRTASDFHGYNHTDSKPDWSAGRDPLPRSASGHPRAIASDSAPRATSRGASQTLPNRGGRGGFQSRNDPSYTPRVGQFWGHDERAPESDGRRSVSGRGGWRGRGGAAAGVLSPRGRGRGRGTFHHDVVPHRGGRGGHRGGSAVASQFDGRGWTAPRAPRNVKPPARKSKLAGWDDDESDIDDAALHGKSAKRVSTAAQPVISTGRRTWDQEPRHNARQHTSAAPGKPSEPHSNHNVKVTPHSSSEEADKQVELLRADWEIEMTDDKIDSWKASLDTSQVSPSLPPQKFDSATDDPSSLPNSNGDAGTGCSDSGQTGAVSSDQASVDSQSNAISLTKDQVVEPAGSLGRPRGPDDGMWTHDGFEAMQRAAPGNSVRPIRPSPIQFGAVRGSVVRGRGRGGFVPFQGRGAFPTFSARGRGGAAGFARGGFKPPRVDLPAATAEQSTDANPRVEAEKLAAEIEHIHLGEPRAPAPAPVKVKLPKPSQELSKPATPAKDTIATDHVSQKHVVKAEGEPSGAGIPPLMSALKSTSSAFVPRSMFRGSSSQTHNPTLQHQQRQPIQPPQNTVAPTQAYPPPLSLRPPPSSSMPFVYPPPPSTPLPALPPGHAVDANGTVYDLSNGQPVAVAYYPFAPHGYIPVETPTPPPISPLSLSSIPSDVVASVPAVATGPTASCVVPQPQEQDNNRGLAYRKKWSSISSIPASAAKVAEFRPSSAATTMVKTPKPKPQQQQQVEPVEHGGDQVEYATGYPPYGGEYFGAVGETTYYYPPPYSYGYMVGGADGHQAAPPPSSGGGYEINMSVSGSDAMPLAAHIPPPPPHGFDASTSAMYSTPNYLPGFYSGYEITHPAVNPSGGVGRDRSAATDGVGAEYQEERPYYAPHAGYSAAPDAAFSFPSHSMAMQTQMSFVPPSSM